MSYFVRCCDAMQTSILYRVFLITIDDDTGKISLTMKLPADIRFCPYCGVEVEILNVSINPKFNVVGTLTGRTKCENERT